MKLKEDIQERGKKHEENGNCKKGSERKGPIEGKEGDEKWKKKIK